MDLVRATGPYLQQILDASHSLWGEGLTRRAYEQYNTAQLKTTWGARHLERFALVEGGRVLSSAKRYELEAVLDGRSIRVLGLGAVFTPAPARGRGYAARLIELMLDQAAREGFAAALLFSEIGPAYYARFGFEAVPRDVLQLSVAAAAPPAIPVRSGESSDLPHIAEIDALQASRYRFALRRSAVWIEYGLTKKRLMAGLLGRGARDVMFEVVEEGSRPVAWVVLVRTARGWTVEECGDRDPSGARAGALLQSLAAREAGSPPPAIRAWLPSGWLPPQLRVSGRSPAPEVMMIRPLQPGLLARPLAAEDVRYWHGDAF